MYPRRSRLTRQSEIEHVKRAGRRLRTEHLEIRSADSLLSHARVAVIVGKHGHTIVKRNKLKRRLREIVRIRLIPVLDRMDVVIRVAPSAYDLSYNDLLAEFEEIHGWFGKMARKE